MISSSNFVAIALLIILARKDPGTTSPFSSLLHPVNLTRTLFSLWAFLRNKEEKFHRHMPNKFDIKVPESVTLAEH